jgi:hypothetical protein
VNTRSRTALAAALLALSLGIAGCGDADDTTAGAPTTPPAADTTTTTEAVTATTEADDEAPDDTEVDQQAYCDAALRIGAPGQPDIDWATASEEEIAAAELAFIEGEFLPQVETVRQQGPDDVRGDATTLANAIELAIEQGNLGEAIFMGPGGDARADIVSHAAGDCGWDTAEVTMLDYEYDAPDTVDAGVVAFELTNDGSEVHEMIVVRRNEGVDLTWQELLDLPDDEADDLVTFVTAGFGPPGAETTAVGELEPGDYAMLCFIPVGATSMDELEGETPPSGPPHFTQGMIHEFTVE